MNCFYESSDGGWRKLHVEFHNLYPQYIIWAENGDEMGKVCSTHLKILYLYNQLLRDVKGSGHLGDVGVDGRVVLRCTAEM
jgi:hypothetical protein